MRLLVVGSLFISSLLAFEYKLQATKVSDNIHCFFGAPQAINTHNNGNMVNSCFVDMGESYLVIDSGPTYNYAKEAYSVMKKIKDLPISYVMNTHTHDDHWLGNGYYKSLGVDIVGSNEFQKEAKVETTRMQRGVSKEAYEHTTQEFPNLFIDKDQTMHVDKQDMFIHDVSGRAHSNSDLTIHIPKLSALFAGDLVFNDRIPSLRDGNINIWIKELEFIKKQNYRYIIGGHGTMVDKTAVDATYTYLTSLKEKVLEALDEGIDIEDATASIDIEEFKNNAMYDLLHRQNVETAYRTLEWEQ